MCTQLFYLFVRVFVCFLLLFRLSQSGFRWIRNKIAQGDVNVFSQIWHFCFFCVPFLHKLLIKSTKYYQIRDQRVWISGNRPLICPISKILFLAAILIFFSKTRFSILPEATDRFCWFSIANIGRQLCTLYSILKKIGSKLRPWECRIEKHTKWPPWRQPFWIFKIGENSHL